MQEEVAATERRVLEELLVNLAQARSMVDVNIAAGIALEDLRGQKQVRQKAA